MSWEQCESRQQRSANTYGIISRGRNATSGAGSWEEFRPRNAAADKLLDGLIGPLIKNYICDESTLQCKPMPNFRNGSTFTNGTDWQPTCGSTYGKECCGKPCPGPPRTDRYGGRLYVTKGGPSTVRAPHTVVITTVFLVLGVFRSKLSYSQK